MARFQRWDFDTFLALMHETVPDYERLQDETVAATGTDARRVLELGTGTGETARRVLARHPGAVLVGLDASGEILDSAGAALPPDRIELRVARPEDPLPDRRFDVVVSALAVHHLDGAAKAELFRRIADSLTPSGRLVLGDFVAVEDPSDLVTPLDPDYDIPSTIADQLRWLTEAGLQAQVAWAHRDLAVLVATRPSSWSSTTSGTAAARQRRIGHSAPFACDRRREAQLARSNWGRSAAAPRTARLSCAPLLLRVPVSLFEFGVRGVPRPGRAGRPAFRRDRGSDASFRAGGWRRRARISVEQRDDHEVRCGAVGSLVRNRTLCGVHPRVGLGLPAGPAASEPFQREEEGMKYPRPARVAAIAVLATLGLGAQASLSGADEPAAEVYGTVEAIDPLVGSDWAPPVEDPQVAQAAASGATVTDEPCAFGDRPGVLDPQIFRRPIRTTGHLVVTPSGNVSLICHAAASAGSFQRPLPTQAIVVDPVPCFLPSGRRTNDAHLVVTPSLHVQLICHFMPA